MATKTMASAMGTICLLCDYCAKNKAQMKSHLKEKHMKPVRYSCPSCNKIYINRGFQNHIRLFHPTWKGADVNRFRIVEK